MQAVKKFRIYNQEPHTISTISNVPDLSFSNQVSNTAIHQSPAAKEVHARENRQVHYGRAYSNDGPQGGYEGL